MCNIITPIKNCDPGSDAYFNEKWSLTNSLFYGFGYTSSSTFLVELFLHDHGFITKNDINFNRTYIKVQDAGWLFARAV